jgi:hypothetical protein
MPPPTRGDDLTDGLAVGWLIVAGIVQLLASPFKLARLLSGGRDDPGWYDERR